jgi:hypothetical protein
MAKRNEKRGTTDGGPATEPKVTPNDHRTFAQREFEDGRDPRRFFGAEFAGQIAFLDTTARLMRQYAEKLDKYAGGMSKTSYLGEPADKTRKMLLRMAGQMDRRCGEVAEAERRFEAMAKLFD